MLHIPGDRIECRSKQPLAKAPTGKTPASLGQNTCITITLRIISPVWGQAWAVVVLSCWSVKANRVSF